MKDTTFWAKGDNNLWYYVREGTGDALTEHEIDEGYVDYIYYDSFASLEDVYDQETYDGGVYYLEKPYVEHTLEEIKHLLEEFENVKLTVVEGEDWHE